METVPSVNVLMKVTNYWSNFRAIQWILYSYGCLRLALSLEIKLQSDTKLGLSVEKGKNDSNWIKSSCCVTEVLRLDDLTVLWSWPEEEKKPNQTQKSNKTKKEPAPKGITSKLMGILSLVAQFVLWVPQ